MPRWGHQSLGSSPLRRGESGRTTRRRGFKVPRGRRRTQDQTHHGVTLSDGKEKTFADVALTENAFGIVMTDKSRADDPVPTNRTAHIYMCKSAHPISPDIAAVWYPLRRCGLAV